MSRRERLQAELEELEAVDPDSLTFEQFAHIGYLRRNLTLLEEDEARTRAETAEREQREQAELAKQAELAEALRKQRAERSDRERLLLEAEQLERRAAELRALYDAGASWSDQAPADRATLADRAAAAAAAPRRADRPMLAEALQRVEANARQAGLDPSNLSVKETADLLAAAGVKRGTIRKWRISRIGGNRQPS